MDHAVNASNLWWEGCRFESLFLESSVYGKPTTTDQTASSSIVSSFSCTRFVIFVFQKAQKESAKQKNGF